MSASRYPWSVLGLTRDATEKEVRRAYATQLKQLDTAKNPEEFQTLRTAYEAALLERRMLQADAELDEADTAIEEAEAETSETYGRAEAEYRDAGRDDVRGPDPMTPFRTMQSLVEGWDYSVPDWEKLLNDPLLDDQETGAAFEFALVLALSENELKTEFTLSASKPWRDLIESRYAWVEDGIRYARLFPMHSELRQTLVALGRSSRPLPFSPVQETDTFAGLGKVAVFLFLLWAVVQLFNRASQGGIAP